MPASFLPSRAFTSVIQQHVCEWKTSTALGTWDSEAGLPTPLLLVGTAAGQTGCRRAGAGEGAAWRVQPQNQQRANQGASGLMMHLAEWKCEGDSTRTIARAASWIRNQKRQPREAYKENLDGAR